MAAHAKAQQSSPCPRTRAVAMSPILRPPPPLLVPLFLPVGPLALLAAVPRLLLLLAELVAYVKVCLVGNRVEYVTASKKMTEHLVQQWQVLLLKFNDQTLQHKAWTRKWAMILQGTTLRIK